jgi:hypothetical protein
MSKDYNGVTFFEPNEKDMDHPAFKQLRKVSLGDVLFPFGFFLVEDGGKTVVIPGTEQDHRKTMLKAFPDRHEHFESCRNTSGGRCIGACSGGDTFRCFQLSDQSVGYYGCVCMDAF